MAYYIYIFFLFSFFPVSLYRYIAVLCPVFNYLFLFLSDLPSGEPEVQAANAGEMATVQCAVIKGDLPIDIMWSFNGRAIDAANGAFDEHNYDNPDIVISRSSKRISQLTIESVAARHAGEYSCTASNTAGTATHSSILSVNGTLVQLEPMTVGWLVGRTETPSYASLSALYGTQKRLRTVMRRSFEIQLIPCIGS
jgi:hypothetical protein